MKACCCHADESISGLGKTKDAVRTIGHGKAHAMPITSSLMQAGKSAVYSAYNTRMAEEQEKKAKEQQLKKQGKRDPRPAGSHQSSGEEEPKA